MTVPFARWARGLRPASIIVVAAVIAGWSPNAVAAEASLHGVALVVGESRYEQLPVLTNPQKDARDIDRLLGDLGFDVDRVLNADGKELHEALDRFVREAGNADVALIYYSGHGIEANGENYIAPTDTDITTPQAAGQSLIAVQPVLAELGRAAPVSIVLLDACRSDPFPPGQLIQLPGTDAPVPVEGQGLAAVRGPTPVAQHEADPKSLGTVIGFAAEPGEPALDGPPGENSPYAAALLKHFGAGGYSFADIMTMVTEEVYLETRAQQLPWTNSSLRRVLSFEVPDEDEGDQDHAAIKTERRKLLLSIANTPEQTQRYVEALAGQDKVPLDALYGMLDVLGIKTSADPADLQDELQKGAEKLKQLLAQKDASVKSDTELERLSRLADEAEREGAIALALKYRDQASRRADALLVDRQSQAAKLKQDMLDIAQTYADNAATALINFDHLHAAVLYGKAYEAVKDWDRAKAFDFKLGQGDALLDQGYYTSDNAALGAALAAYDAAEELAPRESDPLDWAKIEDRKGQVQQTLGQRLADAATLEAAIASYKAALTVRTAEAQPELWASTQNNLANVLYTMGERQRDPALLQQAVDAFDAAMTVLTSDAHSVNWSTVENNKASALIQLATLAYAASDSAEMAAAAAGNSDPTDIPAVAKAMTRANGYLATAIGELTAAANVPEQRRNPLDRAMLQHTLASAYAQRGELNHDAGDLRQAASIYEAVLQVHTRDKMPALWMRTTNNLAIALKHLADETSDPAPMRRAADLYRQVIAATSREAQPFEWADYQQNLGNVLAGLADYEDALPNLAAAVTAYRAAGEVTTLDARGATKWESLQTGLSTALLYEGLKSLDTAKVKEGRTIAVATRDRLREVGQPDDTFYTQFLPLFDKAEMVIDSLAQN